jgi:hypothetical protein
MRFLYPKTAAAMYGLDNQLNGASHSNTDHIAPGTLITNLDARKEEL